MARPSAWTVTGRHIGRGLQPVGDHGRRRQAPEVVRRRVVGVEDGRLGHALVRRLLQQPEEAPLGRPVLLQAAVEVQVVAPKGREDGDIELAGVDPVEGQPVGGRLQDGPLVPGLQRLGQESLDLGRLQGCHVGGVDLGPAAGAQLGAAQEGAAPAGRLQHGSDEMGGGGLAVGAGDAYHPQAARRPAVEGRRQRRQGPPAVRDHHQGHATALCQPFPRAADGPPGPPAPPHPAPAPGR